MSTVIKLTNVFGSKLPDQLLHTITSLNKRKKEIKDLNAHVDHLATTGKSVAQYQSRTSYLNETLENFNGENFEMTIWSRKPIAVGDVVDITFHTRTFTVTQVLLVEDHGGRFEDEADSFKTFYTLMGNVEYYGKPLTPVDDKKTK